jgi:hypothetical protein
MKKKNGEVFTRIKPWYEVNPSRLFAYKDKITRLWFVIERRGERFELQGAGYQLATAYRRYQEVCEKANLEPHPLDKFDTYDRLEKVMTYEVHWR